MAEAKHTPGPWEACDPGDYSDFDGNSRVILGDDMRIAVVQWSPANAEMDDANARLIAAAPDMLAALKNVAEGWGDHNEVLAAIAKATGAA